MDHPSSNDIANLLDQMSRMLGGTAKLLEDAADNTRAVTARLEGGGLARVVDQRCIARAWQATVDLRNGAQALAEALAVQERLLWAEMDDPQTKGIET